jgi:hypothetical protein
VGPTAGLDTEVRGKILFLCRGSNPDRPVFQYIVIHCTDLATPAPVNNNKEKKHKIRMNGEKEAEEEKDGE